MHNGSKFVDMCGKEQSLPCDKMFVEHSIDKRETDVRRMLQGH